MKEIEALLVNVEPLTPSQTVNEVSELLVKEELPRLLSLPVVQDGIPIGTVSRYALQNIFTLRYGREIYGQRPVTEVMNKKPIVVNIDQSIEKASQYITRNISTPITEDYIFVQNGEYCGIGHVLNLLRAMEQRVERRNNELANAFYQLKSSQSLLVQSEKMASIGQMVAGVAHEINTPLGYVKNNVEVIRDAFSQARRCLQSYDQFIALLSSGQINEEELARALAQIEEERESFNLVFMPDDIDTLLADTIHGVNQISEIVVNLRDFSRFDNAPVDQVNINECIDSALLIAKNVIKHKAAVKKQYDELPSINCAPAQINQVFLNLLTNAAQAIEKFGQIIIRTSVDEQFVHVDIQDNGKGIEAENVSKIFDPFFTTKAIGQGTGLGLSITYQIIKNHQGQIKVASKIGIGTRFRVSLPRHRGGIGKKT